MMSYFIILTIGFIALGVLELKESIYHTRLPARVRLFRIWSYITFIAAAFTMYFAAFAEVRGAFITFSLAMITVALCLSLKRY